VSLHQLLGEDLARLNFGGGLAGTEDGQVAGGEFIGDAGRQGGFRADNGEVDLEVFGGFEQGVDIAVFNIEVAGYPGGAGVAGSGVNFLNLGALG
jgi:hypothetical protein